MSQAEELLNSLSETTSGHEHDVPDTDSYFSINPDTRVIESTSRYRNVLMQYDHNSQRYTFELPRYIDGHDMSLCTSVVVNYDNIEDQTETTNSSFYDVEDHRVNPDNPDMVLSSWLISRAATQLAGKLSFSIEYKCTDSDGNVTYEFGTDVFDEVTIKPRKKNSDAEVTEHVDLLEQWRTQIFGAGDTVMSNITAEGEAQVAAVSSEGADQVSAVKAESEAQQEAVELKGAEALESIPEDYTETSNMADEAVRSKSDAIICEAEGETILLTDSSDDHVRGLKVFGKSTQFTTTGKNLLNGDYLTGYGNRNGVEFSDAGNGKININGTSTADTTFVFCSFEAGQRTLLPAGTYTVSGNPTSTIYLSFFVYSDQETSDVLVYNSAIINGNSWTFTIENDAYYGAYLYIGNGRTVSGIISPMLERGSAATDYEPYTGGVASPNPDYPQEIESVENPVVTTVGKNLLFNRSANYTHNGITFKKNADGSIKVTGTATATTTNHLTTSINVKEGETYILTGCPANSIDSKILLRCFNPDGSGSVYDDTGDGVEFKFTNTTGPHNVSILIFNGATVDATFYPMLRHKSILDATYEPYIGKELEITRSLPGIPVTSGGNHIDSDGQQWICDEVDLERGVYIKRLHEELYNGSEDERWKKSGESYFYLIKESMPYKSKANGVAISSRFKSTKGSLPEPGLLMIGNAYGPMIRVQSDVTDVESLRVWIEEHPFTILYELETPIETPLTAEEITAFKALRTNYPNTTILNDAGAWMSVKYNADTKTYIENPKTFKLVDSSTGVVYELKIVDGNLTVTPV